MKYASCEGGVRHETKVRQARLAAGLTQQQLADRVRVSARTIISIEREQYSPSLLPGLSLGAGIPHQRGGTVLLEENLQKEEARYETLE